MRTRNSPRETTVLWSGAVAVSARPWPRTRDWAYLLITGAHTADSALPGDDIVEGWLSRLTHLGYVGVRTGAVSPDIARTLSHNGFRSVQDLTLLSADLSGRSATDRQGPSIRPLRGRFLSRHSVVDRILHIDHVSFGERWALDHTSLGEAVRATHRSRLFVARVAGGVPVGFVLAGMTDSTGFIQRLAVLPDHRGEGIGLHLMNAAHRWLRSRGCSTSIVNTETANEPALRLYLRCGYAELPYGLQVLERNLTTGVTEA